ncbi:hypothetical protein [Sphingomonas alpina]|uniref:Activator protein n=2 Tax=Sphingomonas alpina TaxID=653931 RepID=A0A7H0LKK0_9SPHN|nr:hypothetical protein [Sphingomonas alpina]QNQ10203.1 hypothetical protein H3Z74_02880 [Sphingomonas alpina]
MAIIRNCVAAFACLGMVSPVLANPITSPAVGDPVTATASFTSSISGQSIFHTCHYQSMTGTVTGVDTITFVSGTSSDCPVSAGPGAISFPLIVRTTSTTQVKVDVLQLGSLAGYCTRSNVAFSWNNATSTAASGPQFMGVCTLQSASMTVTPSVVIAP